MSEEKQKWIPLKQAFLYTKRGILIIKKLLPWYLTFSSAAAVLDSVRPLITLYLSARILDELSGNRNLRAIILYAVLAVGLNFLISAISAIINKKLNAQKNVYWFKFRHFRCERYAKLDFEYVEQNRVNELLDNVDNRENSGNMGLGRLFWNVPSLVQQLCGMITSIVLLAGMFHVAAHAGGGFFASGWAILLLLIFIILMLIMRIFGSMKLSEKMQTAFNSLPKVNSLRQYYIEYIKPGNAAKDIRIYRQQNAILKTIHSNGYSSIMLMGKIDSLMQGLSSAASAIISGFVYLLIGLRALAGMYGIGQVTQYVGAVTALSDNLGGFIDTVSVLWQNAIFLKPLYEYLDLPDIKYKGSLTTEKRSDNEYEIEFHNVSFKYPGNENYALRNLNLKFHVGERLAVVGMNGSGKSTMIKLLCRLYDPTEGMISLNGIDIKKYDYREYMDIFSVVFQDFKLLSFTLGQNVAAAVDYDSEEVLSSLNKVGFDARMKKLNEGLSTVLYKDYDENGVTISGGEAQKIALARAIYKKAPFIILDEPTAALDPIAEFEIYSKFNEIVGSKTAIYISHRLSSCRFCDNIAVFDEGRLIQHGSHDELLRDIRGKYYELWNAQAQYYAS